MKRFLSFLLILAVVLSMTGGRSCAGEAENVWNNTVNYVNRSSYADNQLVDRGFFSSIIGVSDDYLVMPLYDLQTINENMGDGTDRQFTAAQAIPAFPYIQRMFAEFRTQK